MRIERNTTAIQRQSAGGAARNPAAAIVESQKAAAPVAAVVSERASKLSALERSLSSQEPFDKSRVETIKAAIRKGEYTINPEKIADSIIETAYSLLRG